MSIVNEYNNIHLIGIGGINVSAAAKLLLYEKKNVSGTDLVKSNLTDELENLGARVSIGHEAGSLGQDVDLVIYSEAAPKSNPERVEALKRGIKQISSFQFWGEYAKNKKVIAVSGTNGKSTTTALIGHILCEAGFDPTVVVGTKVSGWGRSKAGQTSSDNIRIGKSEYLVIEADEYHAHMMELNPYAAVITNIAPDHLDFYKDVDDIRSRFQEWISRIPQDGLLVLGYEEYKKNKLNIKNIPAKLYGVVQDADVRAAAISLHPSTNGMPGHSDFNIVDNKEDWGEMEIMLPGTHNIKNAVAAAVVCDFLGVKRKKILKSLMNFKGIWRRFEYVGMYNGATVVSDYAHHPDGVKATLKAAREWYPFNRIVLLFEPHQHNRTKNLFNDFAESFGEADELILSEIYDVPGREEDADQAVSSKDLVDAIEARENQNISYAPNLEFAEKMLREKIQPEDLVLIMGAGNVDRVARNLVK